MDKNVRMHQWWVTVYFSEPTAAGDSLGSCFIDPYLGRVRGETNVPVEVDTTPRSVIEQGGNTGAGG
jgi:hypothetical protein